MNSIYRDAWLDYQRTFARYSVWITLGTRDVNNMYRKSVLGPLWVTLSTGALAGAIGVFYSVLFRMERSDFVPHAAVGIVFWLFLLNLLVMSTNLFPFDGQIMRQVRISPLVVHLRLFWRQVLLLSYQAIVIVIVAGFYPRMISSNLIWFLPGIVIFLANAYWMSLLIAIVSARYRDIPPIVIAMMQFIFFLTPIIWFRDTLGPEFWIVDINPFLHMVEIVREPLTGSSPPTLIWLAMVGMAVVGLAVSFIVYAQTRRRIVFWI